MAAARDSQVLKKLEKLAADTGSLSGPLDLYRRLLGIQSEARSRISTTGLQMDGETAGGRINSGSPLLGFDDLLVDWPLLGKTFEEIATLFASYAEAPGAVFRLRDSIAEPALLKAAVRAWFDGVQLPAADSADRPLLEFVLGAAIRPCLASHAEALVGLVEQERWRRGCCPVCGGDADFAFLHRETGARWLLCSRCDAEWLFQRLECPYCGNQDQTSLAYFTDDSGLYRLYVCERCHGYLKAIDLRRSEGEVLLPLERFLTLDLDIQAQKGGYRFDTKAGTGNGI